jgi:hypothetical protein
MRLALSKAAVLTRSIGLVITYHLSAFGVVLVTAPSCRVVWRTVHPLLVAVARPRVWFTRIVPLTDKSMALTCRYRPDRSRASPGRKLHGIRELHTIVRHRAQSQADHNSFMSECTVFKTCRHLATPLRFGYRGQSYEERQRLSADSRETVIQLEFPVGTALHGTTKSCARATARRSRHAWGPNGTILLLASCPMSARPNQGIPDLRHQ